jgi:hypothetical protein
MAANLGRLITDYRGLVDACRARADELAISRLEIDRLGGLPVGYAGKLLGKDGGLPGKEHKKMWPRSLELMLGVLGLKIILIEDDVATARTLALRTPVDRGVAAHPNSRSPNQAQRRHQIWVTAVLHRQRAAVMPRARRLTSF